MPYRNVRTLLKKLHIMPNQSEDGEGSTSSRGNKSSCGSSPERSSPSHHNTENKSSSGLSGWLNSVTGRQNTSPPSSSNVRKGERREPSDSVESSGFDLMSDTVLRDLERSNSRDQEMEEEYQIRLALELSAREDPEAVQIEAVKQISLGSCPSQNTPAEIVAYRYWNHNALNYDDKILDGFYDLYGIMSESTSEKMPSLVDLQRAPVFNSINWEAVLVNRAADSDLLKLEQKALVMALGLRGCDLVQKLAALVADHMGGPVGDPYNMLKAWRDLSNCLRATVGSMVLPLGSLTVGLARHRALLFKVLADSAGIPCRLVKGQQYTRSDDVAMNIVKISDGREYIVDLMADPGTLIPSDAAGPQIEFEEPLCDTSHFLRDVEGSCPASSGRGVTSSVREYSEIRTLDKRSRSGNSDNVESQLYDRVSLGDPIVPRNSRAGSSHEPVSKPFKPELESGLSDDCQNPGKVVKVPGWDFPSRHNPSHLHARSPSWTEGVSSPAVRRMKVKDVSQYMIDATKENPQLAQKLHDVLLESGVVAPPNLFTDIFPEQLDAAILDARNQSQDRDGNKNRRNDIQHKGHSEASSSRVQLEHLKRVEVLDAKHLHVLGEVIGLPSSSQPKESDALTQGTSPVKFVKHASVSDAAAAAARADTFASSEVVSAAKGITNLNREVPVTAADNSTAAAVVATTAAVSRQCEQLDSCAPFPAGGPPYFDQIVCIQNDGNADDTQCELCGSGDHGHDASVVPPEAVRSSDRSRANESTKSDIVLDDVTELEIPWEEIILGERIGLGSYGEVYRGEWRGTEVAVKKFLDQDISGDALEEFICEVRIMKRIRHPNVVLFMGAVIHAPNLSIVTEFLPRGSLYRLIHRPNNQLDERRRLRMAIDVARGMNYLHNCTPVIVHRDLKSPNLLVDKNWVVKVCDFGLSRMKHSTFLSSRSTAGTAEWMAPEVLRNEPSDEKCDVYSFGVILWELSTLQQPWGGMNPMQVVGAVGFQHRRLDIPDYVDPIIADIIKKCWQTDPKMRPSFTDIMAALKPLQKPITSAQVPRPRASMSTGQEKGQSSRAT